DDALGCLEPILKTQGPKSSYDKISQAVQLLQSALQESNSFISSLEQEYQSDADLHLHQLPTECIAAIFQHVPLQSQFRLREVCNTWRNVIEHDTLPRQTGLIISGYGAKFVSDTDKRFSQCSICHKKHAFLIERNN